MAVGELPWTSYRQLGVKASQVQILSARRKRAGQRRVGHQVAPPLASSGGLMTATGCCTASLAKPPGGRVGLWLRGRLRTTATQGRAGRPRATGLLCVAPERPFERHPGSVTVQGRLSLSLIAARHDRTSTSLA